MFLPTTARFACSDAQPSGVASARPTSTDTRGVKKLLLGGALVLAMLGVAGVLISCSADAPSAKRSVGFPLPGREKADPTVPAQSMESVRLAKSGVRAAAKAGARWPGSVRAVYEQAGMVWVLTSLPSDPSALPVTRVMCRTLTQRLSELRPFPGLRIRAADGTALVTKVDAAEPCISRRGSP